MKKTILFLLLSASYLSYSQNIEDVKRLDTIYLINQRNEFNRITSYHDQKTNFEGIWFDFIYYDINKLQVILTFNQFKTKPLSPNRKIMVNKKFLEMKREKTISIDFLKKFAYQEIECSLFQSPQIIYIIDIIGKVKNKIPIYEVKNLKFCNFED
jgi:hypothetical protein